MPIRIEPAPDVAYSDALGLLVEEMTAYTIDESSEPKGRAFLIAGHRGAGKTTLVNTAVRKVQIECQKRSSFRRPIKIPLYAPDLLPPEPLVDASGKQVSDAETTLRQVALALYQTAAREFADSYASLVESGELGTANPDLVERATQLRLELDGAPDAAQLRDYWNRAGFLKTGVLFPAPPEERQFQIGWFSFSFRSYGGSYPYPTKFHFSGQGMRELLSLASAAQAYRRVIGTITEKTAQTSKAEQAQQLEASANMKMSDIANLIIVLLASAGVGLGATSLGFQSSSAGFLAAVAALGGGIVLKQSWKRSRASSIDRELTFLPDNSVASLERVLPLLIERFRAAGLVPFFVVDELDKVNRLSERMKRLVKQLSIQVN